MTTRVFIPRDFSAQALGAERVVKAMEKAASEHKADIEIVRNGSRGLYWLEPMVEVECNGRRLAYGPVTPKDVPALFDADFLNGGQHALALGEPEQIPYLKNQERLTSARIGITDPLSIEDYEAHEGFRGLRNALAMQPDAIVKEVTESGLRGRGGAAFPTGIKWQTVHDTPGEQKYIVCNADEGDSGTFSDRMIMEGDPLVLIEGMTIAGIAVGATQGYIYLRSGYPLAEKILNQAVKNANEKGYLGKDILGSGKHFDLEVRMGAGAYICGEETSLLESLEGKRGQIRFKPPLPAIKGLFGKPTIINNVISLASVPIILDKGGAFYKDYGMGRSRGTFWQRRYRQFTEEQLKLLKNRDVIAS